MYLLVSLLHVFLSPVHYDPNIALSLTSLHQYRAFPIRPKALIQEMKIKITTTNCKKDVFLKAFLKVITDVDCLILIGRSFPYFEADTVNVLSPPNVRVTEYVRRRGSLADLNAGAYKFKQVSKYCGA